MFSSKSEIRRTIKNSGLKINNSTVIDESLIVDISHFENEVLKLEIDPKSHSAWTGGKQKILDKGRISKFNKKFQNFRSENKK